MFGAGIRLLALTALVLFALRLILGAAQQIGRAASTPMAQGTGIMSGSGIRTTSYILLAGLYLYIAFLGAA